MHKKVSCLMALCLSLVWYSASSQTPAPTLQEVTAQGNISQRDGENVIFKNIQANAKNYLRWYSSTGTAEAYIGYAASNNRNFYIDNAGLGGIFLQSRTLINNPTDDGISSLQILGPVYANGNYHTISTGGYWASGTNNYGIGWYSPNNDFRIRTATVDRMTIDNKGQVGIGTFNPASQLHLVSNSDHSINISRNDGTYGFRIYRNATTGTISFQIGTTAAPTWESKIQIGEGEGPNTKLLLNPNGGNVGIGTSIPKATLSVNGEIFAKRVKVTQNDWPDYVFDAAYVLPSLQQIEKFISDHKHLPEIPSAKEIVEQGLDVGQNQAKLLQKIEELTLYLIDQNKKLEAQQQVISEQDRRLKELERKQSR